MSSTGRYHTSQDRSRRRVATAVLVIGVVLVVGWIAAISALAGGSRGSEQGGGEDTEQAASPEQASGQEDSEPPGESEPQNSSADQGEDSGGVQPPENESAEPEREAADEQATGEVFDPLEEEPEPTDPAASEPEVSSGHMDGSAKGSTGSPEPEPNSVSGTDETRARAASERYVTVAYGYTGESEDDYLEGIEQSASKEVYDSPGGKKLEGYSQAAPECGMRSTAILEEFEVLGRSPEGLDVGASFSVEDFDGQRHTFSQDQSLTSSEASGGAYEVSGVSVEELTSETTPKESCPGADSGKSTTAEGETDPESGPGGPAPTDKDRARSAADRFITSAYGYTGEDGGEYRAGVARTANEESLYRSPGGERLREYAAWADQDGITAAAVMESFEITSIKGSRITGTARFEVGKEYDRSGGLQGESTPFEQRITLSPVRSTYEVSRASVERQVPEREASGQAASERETAEGQVKRTS